ncbi:hypothetical protein EON65_02490 [archaeon]|nr:MAG: hypothetical protein EON65_02490 [archaeon]
MVLFRLLKIPTSASLAIPRMKLQQIVSVPASSLCEPIEIFDRKMFIKRDDLHGMDSAMSEITGNKSRKLYSLSKMQPFPRLVVSSGGAQSNAMRAIAQLCYHKRSQFIYFARHLPSALLQKPVGNLRHALLLGMKVSYSMVTHASKPS